MVILPSRLVSTDFSTRSHHYSLSNFTPVYTSFILSRLFMYFSLTNIGHGDMMWSTVSSNYVRVCICLLLLLLLLGEFTIR